MAEIKNKRKKRAYISNFEKQQQQESYDVEQSALRVNNTLSKKIQKTKSGFIQGLPSYLSSGYSFVRRNIKPIIYSGLALGAGKVIYNAKKDYDIKQAEIQRKIAEEKAKNETWLYKLKSIGASAAKITAFVAVSALGLYGIVFLGNQFYNANLLSSFLKGIDEMKKAIVEENMEGGFLDASLSKLGNVGAVLLRVKKVVWGISDDEQKTIIKHKQVTKRELTEVEKQYQNYYDTLSMAQKAGANIITDPQLEKLKKAVIKKKKDLMEPTAKDQQKAEELGLTTAKDIAPGLDTALTGSSQTWYDKSISYFKEINNDIRGIYKQVFHVS